MKLLELLIDRGVELVEHGPNVRKGQVNIRCPWCGDADPSHHLGINPTTGSFACWRNIQHRGRTAHLLVMKLFGCSREVAQSLLMSDASEMMQVVNRLRDHVDGPDNDHTAIEPTQPIAGLEPLTSKKRHDRFHHYLMQRGYSHPHIPVLAERYGLLCARSGPFCNRIVFPVVVQHKTIGWVGRCIDDGHLRYLSLPGQAVKRSVLWHDRLHRGGESLYICEGPFDALKIDYVCHHNGLHCRATCGFGVNLTSEQTSTLRAVAAKYQHVFILFDRDALSQAMQLQSAMLPISTTVDFLPDGINDPGELSWGQAINLGRRSFV